MSEAADTRRVQEGISHKRDALTFCVGCMCACPVLQPNCRTEIITSHGAKKIVVLAARPIANDEEITYNYCFASESERIRCNCGSVNCAGRLN